MADKPVALEVADIDRILASTPVRLRAVVGGLPDRALEWHQDGSEWCVKEVVGHLIESERRGFAGRVRQIVDEKDPALAGWDQEQVAETRRDCHRELRQLLDELARVRSESLTLIRRLQKTDLERGGKHEEIGFVTVGDLLQEWIYHDTVHVKQVLGNIQAYVWPAMGATRKFYEE
jgi:hypothetical protein